MPKRYQVESLEEMVLFAIDCSCFGPRTIENLFPNASRSENLMSQLLNSATGLVRKNLLKATAVQYEGNLQEIPGKIVYKPILKEGVQKDSLLEITEKGHRYLEE